MKKSKKRNPILLPALFIVYIAFMAIKSYPRYQESGEWSKYWTILVSSIVMVILLYFIQRRRNKIRDDFNSSEE